jgi:RNA polymerase sigma-70 factor (ECF subfamily)
MEPNCGLVRFGLCVDAHAIWRQRRLSPARVGTGRIRLGTATPMIDRRDRGSLGEAAIAHLDALYNHARHLTGTDADADELVQETYARALARANTFGGGNLKAWLFTILRNTFVDGYRRRQHAAHTPAADADLSDGTAEEPTLLDDAELGRLRRVVGSEIEAALASIAPEARAIILLEVEGFTETEIGEVLDCPVGTVKSRLSRARALLRVKLKDYARSSHGE